MPFLILNSDNSIRDIVVDGDGIEVTEDQIIGPRLHKYGHTCFDYIGGEIVLNDLREAEITLRRDKQEIINNLIDNEKIIMAKERLAAKIIQINQATNTNQLNSIT